jgi:hypothetical protein
VSESNLADPAHAKEAKLPARDWVLLPLIGLLTVGVLAGSASLAAKRGFSGSTSVGEDCMMYKDTLSGGGGVPNSVCWEKVTEGGWVQYRFNSSGYRSDTEFGPKLPGVFRILIIGSSMDAGARVPIEEAFATRLPEEISQRTGQRTEAYNLALAGDGAHMPFVVRRFDYALATKPDLILWALTPWDLAHIAPSPPLNRSNSHPTKPLSWKGMRDHPVKALEYGVERLRGHFDHTDAQITYMLQHFLYKSQSQCIASYLRQADNENGYLKSDPSAQWKTDLGEFSDYDAAIEQRVRSAHVPLVITLAPLRAQAAMISMGTWPPGYDPYKLDDELRAIVVGDGGTYIDILPEFRSIANPEQHYLPIDGHPDGEGHRILAGMLAAKLTGGAVPALSATRPTQTSAMQGSR